MKIFKILLFFLKRWQIFTSLIMKVLLRIAGAKIGNNVYISFSARLLCNKIEIGNDSKIMEKVKINANIFKLGSGSIISSGGFISGGQNIIIGEKTYIGKNVKIDISMDVTIGNNVGFGEFGRIYTHASFLPADEGFPATFEPTSIKDGAWVSSNIIVLPGVTIGEKAVVSAGAVVMKDVPANIVVSGNPARGVLKTEQLKNNKTFVEILESIMDLYQIENCVKKVDNKSMITYEYSDCIVYLIKNSKIVLDKSKKKKKHIMIVKNYQKGFNNTDNYLFDFDSKCRVRTKNKSVIRLHNYFRNYGIRFSIE